MRENKPEINERIRYECASAEHRRTGEEAYVVGHGEGVKVTLSFDDGEELEATTEECMPLGGRFKDLPAGARFIFFPTDIPEQYRGMRCDLYIKLDTTQAKDREQNCMKDSTKRIFHMEDDEKVIEIV